MAFSPRSRTTFGIPRKHVPATEALLDTRSFVRQAPCLLRDKPTNTVQQRLWLDITDLDTTNIEQTDEKYNSNMWKNFKFVRSKQSAAESTQTRTPPLRYQRLFQAKKTIGNVVITDIETDPHVRGNIADIYPLRVPQASRLGEHDYDKFLREAKLSESKRDRISRQLEKTQDFQFRQMKIRSECRAPPLNWEGEILPPSTYRKYPKRFSFDEETEEIRLPYTYISQSTRPYTGSPGPGQEYARHGTPWQYGLRGRKPLP